MANSRRVTALSGSAPLSPLVSVVIPAYRSQETVSGCLSALRSQTFRDFEVVIVDSSPEGFSSAALIRDQFPEVRVIESRERLLPHAARNRGALESKGRILVFTDPDIYSERTWLEGLHRAHVSRGGGVIVGALACHGSGVFENGLHLCKFGRWLPAGKPRPTRMGPTAALLLARADFEAVGGFDAANLLADLTLSRALIESGRRLWFAPDAVAEHHHTQSFASFLRERFSRGLLYGELRAGWDRDSPARLVVRLLATALPIRLARATFLTGWDAVLAGNARYFLLNLPLVLVGHGAALLGELLGSLRTLASKESPSPSPDRLSGGVPTTQKSPS